MLALLLALSLQLNSQYDQLFQMIHLACTYQFPDGDPNYIQIKTMLDMFAPSKKLSDVITDFDSFKTFLWAYTQLDKSLVAIQKEIIPSITADMLKQAYEPIVVVMEKLWTAANFRKGFNKIIDKSIVSGLQELGMDVVGLQKLIKLSKDIVTKSSGSSLNSICRNYLNFDYAAFHSYLYDQIVKKRNFNIGIINEAYINGVKHAFGTPYAVISLMAEISNGMMKPIVTMLTDPKLLENFKAAAEVAQVPQMKNFLEQASKGEIDFSYFTSTTNPLENITANIKDLIQPGGFRRFLKNITTEEQFSSISVYLDAFSGKPLSQDNVIQIQNTTSIQTLAELYNSVLFHFDPNLVLYPNGVKIDPNLKLSDLLDSLQVPGLSGEQIISDIRMIINTMFDTFSVAEYVVGPLYNITLPFLNIYRNIFNAFTESNATIGSAAEAAFHHGKSQLEFYNACQNAKVVDIPKDFMDLEYIFKEFYEKANVTFEKAPASFSEFSLEVNKMLGENLHSLASKYYSSLKGSAFDDEIFNLIRQVSEENATITYESIMAIVSGSGQYMLVNNTLKDIKSRVDAIAVPLCSENGEIRELAKTIFRCDIAGIAVNYVSLMDVMMGSKISVQELVDTVTDLQENLEQAEKVEEEYDNEAGVEPIPKPFSMPVWGIVLICVGAVIIVGAIIAFVVIRMRRRNHSGFEQV